MAIADNDAQADQQGPNPTSGRREADDRAEADTYTDNSFNFADGRPGHEVKSAAEMASWTGQPHIRGSSESMRMALLTTSLIGLQ